MSDLLGPDVVRDMTPGEQAWLCPVRCLALARTGAVVSAAPPICQNIALRGCPRRTKPAEPAQKMNGTSILVERLYAG